MSYYDALKIWEKGYLEILGDHHHWNIMAMCHHSRIPRSTMYRKLIEHEFIKFNGRKYERIRRGTILTGPIQETTGTNALCGES